jgi:predicted dehydrogenase
MDATNTEMTWTITGDRGSVSAPSWPVPHRDDRVILTVDGQTNEEHLGVRTSYTYQLEALAAALHAGAAYPIDIEDAVANMTLVDAAYTAAGFPLRGDAKAQ